jgi:hypothetical protein
MGMLDGEDFRDSVRGRHPPQIESNDSQTKFHLLTPNTERSTQEFGQRASGSGSAFREEMWTPPRQESIFVDPLLRPPAEDLTRIITDIMGHSDAPTYPIPSSTSASATVSSSASLAAAQRLRRNSCPAIYVQTSLPSFESTPTLPLSSLSAEMRNTDSNDDSSWPPTLGLFSDIAPVQRPSTGKSQRRETPPLRPSTGDGSPQVKNWLERTPRRLEPSTSRTRRAASVEH